MDCKILHFYSAFNKQKILPPIENTSSASIQATMKKIAVLSRRIVVSAQEGVFGMVSMICPAPVGTDSEKCGYCNSPVIVSSFSSTLEIPDLSKYTQAYKSALA